MTDRTILPQHQEWLAARGISSDLAAKFGLFSSVASFPPEGESDQWQRAKCIAIPYSEAGQVVNHKYRRVEPKQHVMDKGGKLCLWNLEAVKRAAGGTLVLTEGEWDGMIAEDLGWAASSVPNGTPKKASENPGEEKRYAYLWDARDDLAKVRQFVIAVDGDEAGRGLRADLIALLTPQRCRFVEYPEGTKDLTDIYLKFGVEGVSKALNAAKPVPVKGIHKLADFPDAPDLPMTDLQIPGLEDRFGLVPGTFSIITGYAGHGKSSLTLKMIANLLAGGTNVTIASFETLPKPILERRLMACLVECAEHDPTLWRGERSYKARDILEKRLTVIANTPDEEHELDLDALLELMEVAVAQHEAKLILIDPFNEVEHKRGRDETETEYVGRFIRTIKRFCHRTGCAVWLVAHPRKPHTDGVPKPPSLYDLAGSANFANKADYGLIAHRPDLEQPEIDVAVTKVRMGLPGQPCRVTLRLNAARSCYSLVEA
jgi:twinkle protein